MKRPALLLAACAALLSVAAHAETVTFHATMNARTKCPQRPRTARGPSRRRSTRNESVDLHVTYSGLTGPATAAHIHGPAAAGANAGVLVPMKAPLDSPIKGSATLTDDQVKELMAGQMYANVHTATNPGGELRGQLTH